jgi:hypothetical protein
MSISCYYAKHRLTTYLPLRLGLQPRPAAAAFCPGMPRAYKVAEPDTPETAQLPASRAARRRLPPPAVSAPVREGAHSRAPLAARLRPCQRLEYVPLQRGGQQLDGAVSVWLRPLPALRHGLCGDARRDALPLRFLGG